MGDRMDELQGKVKKGLGDITGNEDMEREGEAQEDAAKLERETEGAIDKGVGKVEETVGDLTDDPETELKGKARQTEGDVKRAG